MSVAKRHSWFFAVAGAAGWIAAGVPLLLYPPVSSPPAGCAAPPLLPPVFPVLAAGVAAPWSAPAASR